MRFTYETPGLRLGVWISLGGLALLLVYLLLTALFTHHQRDDDTPLPPPTPYVNPDADFDLYSLYDQQNEQQT